MDEMKTDNLLNETVNEVVKEKPNVTVSTEDFVKTVGQKFIENKLNAFPSYCDVFRVMNMKKRTEMEKEGDQGWSDKKDFKWDYDIPTELYYFMVNMVYRRFWDEDNEKVWRRFLNSLMKGYDPIECLMKVKQIYGSTASAEKAGIV